MISHIKACIYKQCCELINNIAKMGLSFFINISLLIIAFIQTSKKQFLGLSYSGILLIYITIWSVMMSFTLVNDIVGVVNKDGITEQIFLSSCSIRRYINIQIIIKCIYAMAFVTLIFIGSNVFLSARTSTIAMPASMMVTLSIGVFSIIGVGYIISCVSILLNNKNISFFLRFILLIVIIRSDSNFLIPFSNCKYILGDLLLNNIVLWKQSLNVILSMIGNSLLYYVLGSIMFGVLTSKRLRIQEDF